MKFSHVLEVHKTFPLSLISSLATRPVPVVSYLEGVFCGVCMGKLQHVDHLSVQASVCLSVHPPSVHPFIHL